MKLHITPEQFRELSEKGQQLLREYARKKSIKSKEPYLVYGISATTEDVYTVKTEGPKSTSDMHSGYAVCFNIGQMIEFLDENPLSITLPVIQKDITSMIGKYVWTFQAGKDVNSEPSFTEEELCDALWSAVKETLKHGQN